jgi:hypothetical protein
MFYYGIFFYCTLESICTASLSVELWNQFAKSYAYVTFFLVKCQNLLFRRKRSSYKYHCSLYRPLDLSQFIPEVPDQNLCEREKKFSWFYPNCGFFSLFQKGGILTKWLTGNRIVFLLSLCEHINGDEKRKISWFYPNRGFFSLFQKCGILRKWLTGKWQ